MGSGASKDSSGSLKRTQTKDERVREAHKRAPKSKDSDEFHNACMVVFQNADKDGNGILDNDEFWSVLESKTLNLKLSKEEMESIKNKADMDNDGGITYTEFIPVVRDLLTQVYAKKDNDWNDWCKITQKEGGKVLYMNKRTGQTQHNVPPNYQDERVEERQFDYITLEDGTEVTTYVEDTGQRMFMDWDLSEWQPFPDEWYAASSMKGGEDGGAAGGEDEALLDEKNDPRVGEYVHATRGTFPTYLFENTRNTRLYFDEPVGQWARMPLAWERNVSEVKADLTEMSKCFPNWKNVDEMLLALRECNYDLQDTLVFVDINYNFGGEAGESAAAAGGGKAPFGRRASGQRPETPPGSMSVAAASRIDELERQVVELTKNLDAQKEHHEETHTTAVASLTREKTKVEGEVQRKERIATEAQEKVDDLAEENVDLKARLSEAEKKIVAYQGDADRMKGLETDLEVAKATGGGGGGGGDGASAAQEKALKEKTDKLNDMRMENVALKLKAQTLKDKLASPAGGPQTMKFLKECYTKVKHCQDEKNAAAKEYKQSMDELQKMFTEVISSNKKIADNTKEQVADITKKYRAEQMQRRLLYNQVQELRGNIRVFARVRSDDRNPCMMKFPDDNNLLVTHLDSTKKPINYEFEHVYSNKSKQEDVFKDTEALCMSCVDGYNVCIMAYGQTGSGKTYTMQGPPDNPGVNRRAIAKLIQHTDEREEVDFHLSVSVLEVYNEKLFDLLTGDRSKPLSIHQGADGTYVGDLTSDVVKTEADVQETMAKAEKHRSVSSTKMNSDSSRSHLLLQLMVVGQNKISGQRTFGKLTLVDLAGSERISKTEAAGERLVEAAAINKSLTALGQVFQALATNSPHVPYRNSKLTHALQDSLGGDSKTCVFVALSPLESNLAESHSTLKFGQNIRKIELGPATKKKGGPPKPKGRK